ncbi:hypothetical protein GE21DRAFT_2568 [Neurospora crassa]|uniref:Uncharacterized protein n=2 Tax=Neurospora crassa TaxID=5141 RepID=Q7SCU4_NEUCR|nr:hypothetical protein NCU09236 [Neurospora crassa OR74A]EAA34577.1 hypothetical protein NCU09236 [Neurospora crassa OR74A]KHE80881.1 hypothetical protein GE21DRAFT_2568 [Neurospora crassa]CAE76283.1 conserved hypothetical protein [Neurospora crassa]|eukprot:XP_963813.1 hypothetical protein NCU09236 [Neurospora crassa OR74A]
MKSFALTTALSLAMAGSTLAVPMMQQGHAIAHINAEALKNNLAMAKANMNTKRQTTPATSPAASVPAGTVPSVALTDLDRVVSSVGVIVKNAQDDFQKIDIKDPQGITGILSQLLGNVTQTVQQGARRIKANQKAAILPLGGAGWGLAGGAFPLGGLGLGHPLGGLGGLLGVTDGLAGLTGVTGLLSSLLNTVTGLLGNLLQLGGGSDATTGGLDANTLASLANLQALLSLSGGLTGGVPLGTLPLGDLSNLAGILSPELLNQLLSGTAAGSPLSVVESLLEAVQELLSSVLSGSVGVTAGITGDLGADADASTSD